MVKAIATHETHYGKTGVGKEKNNLCGIKRNGRFEAYKTQQAGFDDCYNVYMKFYKDLSIHQMSRKWTTTQQDEWESNVNYYYNKYK